MSLNMGQNSLRKYYNQLEEIKEKIDAINFDFEEQKAYEESTNALRTKQINRSEVKIMEDLSEKPKITMLAESKDPVSLSAGEMYEIYRNERNFSEFDKIRSVFRFGGSSTQAGFSFIVKFYKDGLEIDGLELSTVVDDNKGTDSIRGILELPLFGTDFRVYIKNNTDESRDLNRYTLTGVL